MTLRVVEVIPTLRRAGAENVVASLVRHLDRSRFETTVVSLYDAFDGGLENEIGVPIHHLGKRRGFDPGMWPRLARTFRELRPGLVHTHSYVLRYVWSVCDAPVVHTVHNVAEREADALGRAINRFAFRRGAVPVAVSGEVARSVRSVYGLDAVTIPNGIEMCRPDARERWRSANGFAPDDVLVVSVMRFEPQKNPLGLIDAFARILDCRLLMVGDGSMLERARRHAAELGVVDRLHFLGMRSDVREILSACDVFVLASLWEGSPLSVMEAMAAGLPVVAAAVGGVPELVADGETGLLVSRCDSAALSSALARLANDPILRRRMGEAAQKAAQRFSAPAMAAAYGELFERVAGRRR